MDTQPIDQLAKALAQAQSEILGAEKNAENPHFKSKFSNLQSVWDAIRVPLTKNGLSVIQRTQTVDGKLVLETILLHQSGQSISGVIPVLATQTTPQAMGSALSYSRRYALMAMVGVAAIEEDDDAELAQGRGVANTSHASTVSKPQANTSGSTPSEHRLTEPARNSEVLGSSGGWITEPQRKRLFALMKKASWSEEQLRDFIKSNCGIDSTGSLKRQQYDFVCDTLDKKTSFEMAKSGPICL